MPRTRPLLLVLLVSALSWLGATGTAQAHTGLSSSSPAEGSTVAEALTVVTLTFSGAARSPGITVTGPDGAVVSTGPATDAGNAVTVPVAPTTTGQHTVTWAVTSADGHEITGTIGFAYAGPVAAPATSTAPSEVVVTATSPPPEPVAAVPVEAAADQPEDGSNLLVTSVAALLALGVVGAVVLLVRRLRR